MKRWVTGSIAWLLLVSPWLGTSSWAQTPAIQPYLDRAALQEAVAALEPHLKQQPSDQNAQFALGTVRLMQAIEHLGQNWYRYGQDERADIPFLRLPVQANPQPEPITYQQFRGVLEAMVKDLQRADEALAKVTDPKVKLPLNLFTIHLDFDGNGKPSQGESLNDVSRQFFGPGFAGGPNRDPELGLQIDSQVQPNRGQPGADQEPPPPPVIAFDYADALWMRGYTHLLRSMLELALAYDHEPLWNVTAHYAFPKAVVPLDFVQEEIEERQRQGRDRFSYFDERLILDAIAGVHLLDFKLRDPDGVRRTHGHLKQMVALSRQMWQAANAETDNDREWIPNPRQQGALAVPVNQEMVQAWGNFLDELESILDGKTLIPFWRGTNPRRGVNLKRALLEPQDLDVVLWAHGSGAVDYLELGEVSTEETWGRFQRVFRGEFFGFAMWFN